MPRLLRIIVPGFRLNKRLALAGLAMARRQACRHLIEGLGSTSLAALDALLVERAGDRSILAGLRRCRKA